jgi:quinoprotein glucose dehydrogenase
VQLDLLESAAKSRSPAVKDKLTEYENSRKKNDPLAAYAETLTGGDPKLGEKIFRDKAEVSCIRCHKIAGNGGEVGPNLFDVGKRKDRTYLLESILLPNKEIAPGFEGVVVKVLKPKKKTYNGVLKAETDTELTIDVPDQGVFHVKKTDIVSREHGPSAMVEGLEKQLTKRELRDLVEFLAQQK